MRLRVTLGAALVVTVVLGLTGFVVVTGQRRVLVRNVDTLVREQADALEAILIAGQVPPTLAIRDPSESAAQIVDSRGRVVGASANVAGSPPIAEGPPNGRQAVRDLDNLPLDDDRYRVLSRTVTTPNDTFVIHVAGNLDEVVESAEALTLVLIVAFPLVVAFLSFLVWRVVGRSLAPVEAIRREVEAMRGRNLDQRVSVPPGNDEIARLATTMNAMLDRVETASERQQRFVADAAHELRTPLTRLRTELEVDERDPSLLEEIVGLQHLVDNLLLLARADNNGTYDRKPVDLDDIVLAEAAYARGRAGLTLNTSRVSAAQVRGDRDALTRVVRNLVDNALRHARTSVTVELREDGSAAELMVADDGPGISPAERQLVFERFVRLDEARARGAGGFGLGLSIAREIVEGHGGTIAIDDAPGGGARLVVRLPHE